jgi:ribosomal protein S18 acetylase RimI-like enzyme
VHPTVALGSARPYSEEAGCCRSMFCLFEIPGRSTRLKCPDGYAVTAPSWISEPNIEVLDLRHFLSADLRPLLEEETRVWSQVLFWDYHSSADMILRYADAKILPGYAVVNHGRVTGYCFFVYEGNKGVIGDLFVTEAEPLAAGKREEQLLNHAIATLQQSPGIHRIEVQLLLHAAGTVAKPFADHNFRRYPRLFMTLPLERAAPMPALPPEIELRNWDEHDYQTAAALITASYRGHIDADINDQYRSIAGSLRFLNNIVRFPGCGQFDNGASFIALHRPTRMAVGLVLCSRVRNDVGHITQVCVMPEQRGRRLGEALLAATANELRRRNFSALTLTVTEANDTAITLYKRLDYRVHRVFDAFVWDG